MEWILDYGLCIYKTNVIYKTFIKFKLYLSVWYNNTIVDISRHDVNNIYPPMTLDGRRTVEGVTVIKVHPKYFPTIVV